jgi:hypothetical protein
VSYVRLLDIAGASTFVAFECLLISTRCGLDFSMACADGLQSSCCSTCFRRWLAGERLHGRPAFLGQNLFHERHICRLPLLRHLRVSLSISYLQTGDERGLARMAAGRYVRLAIPIFAICSITYLLLALNIIPPFRGKAAPAGYLWHVHAKCCGTVRIFAGWGVCVSVQRRKLRSAAVDHVL